MRTSDKNRSFIDGAILTSFCDLAGSAALATLLVLGREYLVPSGFVFGLLFIVTSGLLIYGLPRETSAVLLFWMTFKVCWGSEYELYY